MTVRDSQTLKIASAHEEANSLSDENQARLAQLMTVWISGYLEVICRDILLTYVEETSDKGVARFVGSRLKRIRSPEAKNILDLVRSFDEERAEKLKKFLEGEIKESVDSVVNLRHQIAHGRSTNTTIKTTKKQFDDSQKLEEKLRELFAVAA